MIKKKVLPSVNICGDLSWEDEDGNIHRDGDKPAVITPRGQIEYLVKERYHRAKGKPAIIGPCGYKQYWEHGAYICGD